MASLSLTGPANNPDLDHTQSHQVIVHSQDTTVDGIQATLEDVTDAANPVAAGNASVTYTQGSQEGTVTVSGLSDDRLYLLRVWKLVAVVRDAAQESFEIAASIHLDTRPAGTPPPVGVTLPGGNN